MPQRYVVFDVETPNSRNDRMSAIGITIIENGCIVERFYSLVNPDTHFDAFNIKLTHITPEMVADQPNFAAVWKQIDPIMSSGLLVAHSAIFDMSVLAKCLFAYQIPWKPFVQYACTCQMGRSCYPHLDHHTLNALCEHLNIELDHHNAGSDSLACAQLLLDYMAHGINIDENRNRYDFQRTFAKLAAHS